MCGLFGAVTTSDLNGRRQAAQAFKLLGYLAQERGRDAAGVAMFVGRPEYAPASPVSSRRRLRPRLKLDGWYIERKPIPFEEFWRPKAHGLLARRAQILLGHTRLATKGAIENPANVSPMVVGDLIGTHNGGVAIRQLMAHYHLLPTLGETSSEAIFAALNPMHNGRRIEQVLRNLEGRATLAWVNRNRPKTVYLARTALSPLAIAWDSFSNLYWASNYHWFEELDRHTDKAFGFRDIMRVEEGSLLTIRATKTWPVITSLRAFQPYARLSDYNLSVKRLWRGFSADDIEWEALHNRYRLRNATGRAVKLDLPPLCYRQLSEQVEAFPTPTYIWD